MPELSQAATLLSALAAPGRLTLLTIVAERQERGEQCTPAALAAVTGRDLRPLLRDAARLAECGLLDLSGGTIRANLGPLRDAAEAIEAVMPIAPLLKDQPDVARYFSHGRLVDLPEDPARRAAIARILVGLLPADRSLSEAEVNEALNQVHADHATLRRMLVDHGLVSRGAGVDYRVTVANDSGPSSSSRA